MKKIFFSVFFVLFLGSNLNAEWTKSGSVSGNTIYFDQQTLKIVNNIRYILIMVDYAKPSDFGDLSSRSYIEINCNNMMRRSLVKDYFKLPLAKGNTSEGSGSIKDLEWIYNKPTTLIGNLNKRICEIN